MLSDLLAAARHGAALVYHEIVAAEADVTKWKADHPEVGPLINAGTGYAMNLLTAANIPIPAIESLGAAVLSALKDIAAQDTDVESGGPSNATRTKKAA